MSRTSVVAVPPRRQPFDRQGSDGAPCILVIEEDSIAAGAVQRMLHELGYDAWAAASTASEALALAAEKAPHVVLAEVRIQGRVDGIDAAFDLRQRYGAAIVFLTAHADDPTLERAKRAEPSGYLIKPASAAAVKVAIELALEQRERDVAMRALESSLAETAVALLSALNFLPFAVQLEDAQGRVVHTNPAFRSMFSLGDGDLSPMGMESASLMQQVRSRCRDTEVFEKIVESRERCPLSSITETVRLVDGREIELYFIPIFYDDRLRGRLWTYRDINGPTRPMGAQVEGLPK